MPGLSQGFEKVEAGMVRAFGLKIVHSLLVAYHGTNRPLRVCEVLWSYTAIRVVLAKNILKAICRFSFRNSDVSSDPVRHQTFVLIPVAEKFIARIAKAVSFARSIYSTK